MTTENSNPETSALVEVKFLETAIQPIATEPNSLLPKTEMDVEGDEVERETKALIEAIKKRAQAEMEFPRYFTREHYLNAVRRARIAVEQEPLLEKEKIEKSVHFIHKEAEKTLVVILSEIESLAAQLFNATRMTLGKIYK